MYDITDKKTLKKNFAVRLNDLLIEEGLTNERFGELIGVSDGTVKNWRNVSNTAMPQIDMLMKICNCFYCDLDYLFKLRETKTPEATDVCAATGLSAMAANALTKPDYDEDNDMSYIKYEKNFFDFFIYSTQSMNFLIRTGYSYWMTIYNLQNDEYYDVITQTAKRIESVGLSSYKFEDKFISYLADKLIREKNIEPDDARKIATEKEKAYGDLFKPESKAKLIHSIADPIYETMEVFLFHCDPRSIPPNKKL